MTVDGKKIADDIYADIRERVSALSSAPRLSIIVCNPNFETKKYLTLKEKKARSVGIEISIVELEETQTTEDFVRAIGTAVGKSDGIIVQLPLPPMVDRDHVLCAVPPSHDVDALNPHTTAVLSPVVGAIAEILSRYEIAIAEKFVTVIGSGRLVGLPAYDWFQKQGAHVSVVTRDTNDIQDYAKNADIVVCGAGVSELLKPEMIKDGVIILDAGTSEEGGELRGDADPLCAEKASLFTPVPGGIGPMTIAILLKNLVTLTLQKS